jgi:hypothetical protein
MNNDYLYICPKYKRIQSRFKVKKIHTDNGFSMGILKSTTEDLWYPKGYRYHSLSNAVLEDSK